MKMNVIALSTIFLCGLAVNSCKVRGNHATSTTQSAATLGQITGFEEIDNRVKSRLFEESEAYYLFSLYKSVNTATTALKGSLGAFAERGQNRDYLNGDPNPLSAYLWSNIFSGFAEKVSAGCPQYAQGNYDLTLPIFDDGQAQVQSVTLRFKESVGQLLADLCGDGANAGKFFDLMLSDATTIAPGLKNDWLAAYYPPNGASTTAGTGAARVKQVLYETLMSPFTLLRYQ